MEDENDIVFKWSVCVCVGREGVRASSVSDHQVDSQMATPSADPCLALANTQLASAPQPRREICGPGDHMASVTSVALISSLCSSLLFSMPSLTWISNNILDPEP